jgi:hypothetical protein
MVCWCVNYQPLPPRTSFSALGEEEPWDDTIYIPFQVPPLFVVVSTPAVMQVSAAMQTFIYEDLEGGAGEAQLHCPKMT